MKRARGIGIALLLICCGAFVFITDYVGAVIAICGVSIVCISFLCALVGRIDVKLHLHTLQFVEENQPLSFQIEVKNGAVFPPGWLCVRAEIVNLFTEETEVKRVVIPLSVRCDTSLQFSKISAHCGAYRIRVRSAILYDFFGFLPIPCKRPAAHQTTILPQRLPVDVERICLPMYEDFESLGEGKSTLRTDTTGVREYLPGDSMRDIHWKLSVRTDNLFVREYAAPHTASFCMIAMNNGVNLSLKQSEQWACIVHTLAHVLLAHQVSFTVMFCDTAGVAECAIGCEDDWTRAMRSILSVPMQRTNCPVSRVKEKDFTNKYSVLVTAQPDQPAQWIGQSNTDVLFIGSLPYLPHDSGQKIVSIETMNAEAIKRAFTVLLMQEGDR